MVMDYSEKRKIRESMERKPVQKNRPRKESSGMFALLSIAVLVGTFGAGVLTGWLIFKGTHKGQLAAVAPQPVKKDEAAPAAAQPKVPPPDTQLTFYKTLPAGGKAALGSGINPKKPEPQVPKAAPKLPPSAPVATPAGAPAGPEGTPAAAQEGAKASEKGGTSTRYTVQIASYRDKKEADAAQAKLAAKGVAAYLVESKVPDKGVWYRIRVGKHLSRSEAEELVGKTGKGAMVLAE